MSLKEKKKEFRFTFKIFFRLLIFSIIVIVLISFLSNAKPQKSILGTTDIKIDTNLLKKIPIYQDVVNTATSSSFFQNNLKNIQLSLDDFPQKQIREIQKMVVTNVYRDIINNIDKK